MDVVIIGAGLSGLTAAVTLQEAGISVQVLEADAQIGGRIRSVRDGASTQAVADLGPTWVWPKYQPVVARWLSKLDIKRNWFPLFPCRLVYFWGAGIYDVSRRHKSL